jgi:hypothetical protein
LDARNIVAGFRELVMIRELVECFKISEEGVEKNGEGVNHPPEVVLNM